MAKRSTGGPNGILLIDKPQGWTSHDVVAKARGICRQRRIGHTGTLDPMATGLLVLCLGHATRLVEYMTQHDKRYQGEITLGVATDTDDAEGQVLATHAVPPLDPRTIGQIERRFTGELLQRPPAFSAVKVGGQRAYAVARKGGNVELAARRIEVYSIQLRQVATNQLQVSVHCGPGTYIRSIARDIGRQLGCGAHLSSLRRTEVGALQVRDALTLEQLAAVVSNNALPSFLLPADEGVREMQAALLSAESAGSLRHGRAVDTAARPDRDERLRAYDAGGYFVGISQLDVTGVLRPVKVMANESGELDVMSPPDTNGD